MKISLLGLLLATSNLALADRLVLRNGKVVEGTFVGGDARSIRMAVGERIESFSVSDVAALEFAPVVAAEPAEPKPEVRQAAPPAQAQPAEERKAYLGWEQGAPEKTRVLGGVDALIAITAAMYGKKETAAAKSEPVAAGAGGQVPHDTRLKEAPRP